jgi:hypothetical protein
MPSDYARRGRPRGSGLDDRVQLRRIAELLEADPNLKPTTAIKALGISDPSTIRRLRDKLKSQEHPGSAAGGADRGSLSSPMLVEARSSVQASLRPVRQARSSSAGLAEATPSSTTDAQLSWFARWCALGFSAMSSTVEAQMALMDEFFQVPQVESALRHQLKCNEVAKAFCLKRSDTRMTLH